MRRDIQFLRGVAVLAVLLYHAGLPFIPNGYLGVDIFFVISGFLITMMILKGLEGNQFSFTEFYLRRARRLLPALYCTLAVVTLLSFAILTDRQWEDFRHQLYGALTFTSNLVLPLQVGYFEDAADTKPLLHIWSLSLEEQYYLVLPLLLFITSRALRGVMLLGLASASLVFCLVLVNELVQTDWLQQDDSAVWAFYLLPARAWQLLAGSLIAWHMIRNPHTDVPVMFKLAALASLLFLLCFSIDDVATRGNAIAATFLTAFLLVGRDNWLGDVYPNRVIELVGDWSYSLYLVHWPLLAFAQVAFLGEPPGAVIGGLVALSFLLAFVQFRYVEQPFRRIPTNNPSQIFAPLVLSTVALIALALPSTLEFLRGAENDRKDLAAFRGANYGLHWKCGRGTDVFKTDLCRTSAKPRVAIWGDSFAMHLVPGLLENEVTKGSLVQITQSNCNPIRHLTEASVGYEKAQTCIEFNAEAIRYMASTESIEIVVIGSPFGYFYGGRNPYYFDKELRDRDPRFALATMVETIKFLQDTGKTVVLFSPPPSGDFDLGECLERKYVGAVTFGRDGCDIDIKLDQARKRSILSYLKQLEQITGSRVIWLADELCDGTACLTELDSVPLYRDRMHLSVPGSKALIGNMQLM